MSAGKDDMENPEYVKEMEEKMAKAVSRMSRLRQGKVRVPDDCSTLEEAVKRVHEDDHLTTIVLEKGEHLVAVYGDEDGEDDRYLEIPSAMNIVGVTKVAKEEIVVKGGIYFVGGIQGNCHLQHLTLRQAKDDGVFGHSSFTMEDVLVKECGRSGVVTGGTGVVGRCTNVEVCQCGSSGVFAFGGSITLIGAKTTVHNNCTQGDSNDHYGLKVFGSSSSSIQLISPLTKEQVSHDNGGGANWGAAFGGDIHQIKTIFERMPETEVRVPKDCGTLEEAVEKVHGDSRLTTILVETGVYQIDGEYLVIPSAMNIVGDPEVPKEKIVVLGGIRFEEGIPGSCLLQHLTLRQALWAGVNGESSFTMDDVLVEQCGYQGVRAHGTGVVGRCTDVEVRECGWSGLYAQEGASITLIGAKTKVHDNCTEEHWDEYGLKVGGLGTIQLVSPLTKEQVSYSNGGGGNWVAYVYKISTHIKTIFERMPETEVRVPEDYKTLQEAVEVVRDNDRLVYSNNQDDLASIRRVGLTTIVLGKGKHVIDRNFLQITYAMNIVGDPWVPRDEIVVLGGIRFRNMIKGNCHLQHLTLRFAKNSGVLGYSSFTMDDVLVEQCNYAGVVAWGPGVVGRCTNVEVRRCGQSGVVAQGDASIILIGDNTTVHHNCTKSNTNGTSNTYGLKVGELGTPTIQLVFPLTKEQVSYSNDGGGNWGAEDGGDINQIKNRLSPLIQSLYTRLFTNVTDNGPEKDFVIILQKIEDQGQLNVNHKNEQGLTMLTTACVNGQIKWIKILMKRTQIDGTMTREQFIRCTAFPQKWLNGEALNHPDTITLDDTIGNCPVRCLPCRHPFEAIGLLEWLGGTVDFVDNPQRLEPHTKCPGCNSEVQNVELMSSDLVTRWNTMDRNFIEAEEVLRNENSSPSEREKAERVRKINNYPSRYRQFVKTKL